MLKWVVAVLLAYSGWYALKKDWESDSVTDFSCVSLWSVCFLLFLVLGVFDCV